MKKFFLCTVIFMVILLVNVMAESYPRNFAYFDLSKVSTCVSFVPSHTFIRSDQYGNVVILNTLYPTSLYVTSKKDLEKVEKVPFPFSGDSLVSGIDIFKTFLIFFVKLNPQSSKFYAVLYDYRKRKVQSIVSFDSYIEDPEFSWNGQELAFVQRVNSTSERLMVLNLSTGKEKIVSKNVVGPFATESEIGWSKSGNICFGLKYPEEGITYDNMGFVVASWDGSYRLKKFYPLSSKTNSYSYDWKNFSFPFFVSNSTIGFVDGCTSTLVMFNFLTCKVVETRKLNVNSNCFISVQYTDGKLLVITLGKRR